MAEPIVATIEPKVEPKIEPKVEPAVVPQEDLVTRASKVELKPKATEPSNEFGLSKEDYDKVTSDPSLQKIYKSMQSDYGRKTQSISEQRKYYEQKLTESGKWTPQRVQEIMNDQNFVQAASQVLQSQPPQHWTGTQNEWSALNDTEKQRFAALEQSQKRTEQMLFVEQQRRQDEQLKQKFANYDPNAVDIITNELLQGKRNATREDIFKVVDYENMAKRSYELGKQDALKEAGEKNNATSYDGMTVTSPNRTQPPQKEESNSQGLRRIFLENLAKFKGRNT